MTTTDRPQSDVQRLVEIVAARGEVARVDLERVLAGWSAERLGLALSSASMIGDVQNGVSTSTYVLGPRGRQMVAIERRQAVLEREPSAPDERPPLERYQQAANEALPAFAEQCRRRHLEQQQQRQQEAQLAWSVALGALSSIRTFAQDWQQAIEPDPRLGLLVLRPRFGLPGGREAYVRIYPTNGGVWLRSSAGGEPVWLGTGSGAHAAEQALGLALLAEDLNPNAEPQTED